MPYIKWSSHRDSKKVGAVENVTDRAANVAIQSGMAVAASKPAGSTAVKADDKPTDKPSESAAPKPGK